jgi:hypothetical protein
MHLIIIAVLVLSVMLFGCHGKNGGTSPGNAGGASYWVGGTVSGLTGTLVVQNNSTDDLTITSNGTFRFETALASGSTYTITVKTNPIGQRCTITNSSGSSNGTDVSNVAINCITHNIVFVTSTSQTGNLGGLAGADAICAARAAAAGLPGTYIAWLSTSGTSTINAKDRLGSARGWIRPDGLPFVDTVDDLTSGKIFYPPRLDEFGNDVGKQAATFTATTDTGLLNQMSGTCQNWTSTSGAVYGGWADGGTQVWTWFSYTGCNAPLRLYCFGIDQSNPLASLTTTGRMAFASINVFQSGGGIAAADTICQSEATAASFSGSYKALLATESASAASRFSMTGVAWVRPDGVAVVDKASDLATDLLLAPLNVTAGGMYLGNYGIWVGANNLSDPGSGSTCSSWTSNSNSLTGIGTSAGLSEMGWGESAACNANWMEIWCLQE